MSETARALPDRAVLCSWTGCNRKPEAHLAERKLCLQHFFEFAYRRMNGIRRVLDDPEGRRGLLGEAQSFLTQVVSQTTLLATQIKLLDPSLRERLLSLSTGAAELYDRVRRTLRLPRRVLCVLRTGIVSSEAGERCSTVNISQRGACLELSSPQRVGREVTLQRVDNNKSARVKITWVGPKAAGKYLVGVEILDSDDFWTLGSFDGSLGLGGQP